MVNVLDELLPHNDSSIIRNDNSIRYDKLKTKRVNGKKGIVLPNGRIIGKVWDKNTGMHCWTIIGREK